MYAAGVMAGTVHDAKVVANLIREDDTAVWTRAAEKAKRRLSYSEVP